MYFPAHGPGRLCGCRAGSAVPADGPARVHSLVPRLVEELGSLQGDRKYRNAIGPALVGAGRGGPSSPAPTVPYAWLPAMLPTASCWHLHPPRLSASAGSSPPPLVLRTAGTCLWPVRCFLEGDQVRRLRGDPKLPKGHRPRCRGGQGASQALCWSRRQLGQGPVLRRHPVTWAPQAFCWTSPKFTGQERDHATGTNIALRH